MIESIFSADIEHFLYLLYKYEVDYLIVGGEAVIYYGHSRLTGDIDIFYERSSENVKRLFKALEDFWERDIPGIKSDKDLRQEGVIFQFGVPPNRIDLINDIEGVDFKNAFLSKQIDVLNRKSEEFKIYYIGLNELIKNKKSVNRHRDKEDLKFLERVLKQRNKL